MVNPKGKDSGNEWIEIHTPGSLQKWKIQDQGGRSIILGEETTPQDNVLMVREIRPLRLVNTGGSLSLYNPTGELVDQVKYTKGQVKGGEAIIFHS